MDIRNFRKRMAISRLFAFDPGLEAYLFDSSNLRSRPEVLMDDAWELSVEQRILLRAALDIWNGRGNVFLWELLNQMNGERIACLIEAIRIYGVLHRSGEMTIHSEASR